MPDLAGDAPPSLDSPGLRRSSFRSRSESSACTRRSAVGLLASSLESSTVVGPNVSRIVPNAQGSGRVRRTPRASSDALAAPPRTRSTRYTAQGCAACACLGAAACLGEGQEIASSSVRISSAAFAALRRIRRGGSAIRRRRFSVSLGWRHHGAAARGANPRHRGYRQPRMARGARAGRCSLGGRLHLPWRGTLASSSASSL